METIELFKKFTELTGISGNEKRISSCLKESYQLSCDDVIYDNLGSIYGVKKSKNKNAPKVMITGHLDEAGFIVRELLDNGLVKALVLGKHCEKGLLGASIKLETREGQYYSGTLTSFDDKETVLSKHNEVLVDIGAATKQELLDLGVSLGDSISYQKELSLAPNGQRLFAKAINGRYGCVLGLELLEILKDEELDFDICIGATVQEEVGLRGAQTATQMIKPDLAICLDTLPAMENEVTFEKQGLLGKGALITYYDKTMLPNRTLLTDYKNIFRSNKLHHQHYFSLGDSDAGWIHKLALGTPTLFANIPVRNINTNTSVMDLRDYEAVKTALQLFIHQLDANKIQEYKTENR